jgi:gas vesicle protein
MKTIKILLIGIIIGGLVGFWTGYNKGRDEPIFSNPFKEHAVSEKVKTTIGEGMEKAGKNIEQMGKDIKDKMEK